MTKKSNSKSVSMDERQTQERHRLGFHCFIIVCVELCVVLVASMFCYEWINTQISFYNVLMFCLMFPVIYFNIRTKISGVTNYTECVFSIMLAVLYIVSIIASVVSKNFSIVNLVFGILFIINGFIGIYFIRSEMKANKADYDETHGTSKADSLPDSDKD